MHFLSSSSIICFSLPSGSGDPPFSLIPVIWGIVFRARVVGLARLKAGSREGLVEELDGGVECSRTDVGGGGSGRSRMSWGSKRGTGSGGGTSFKSMSALILSKYKSSTGLFSGWIKAETHVSTGDDDLLPVKNTNK